MDNFKEIYKLLLALERSMGFPSFDIEEFRETSMKVSQERLYRYFEMLQDAGLIKGADLFTDVTGELCVRNPRKIRITLDGLEYLQENSIMKKMYRAEKGVTDLVP